MSGKFSVVMRGFIYGLLRVGLLYRLKNTQNKNVAPSLRINVYKWILGYDHRRVLKSDLGHGFEREVREREIRGGFWLQR